ncbi:PREDICTED: probable E3 ubiquitin-protein ligase makorin-1 [Nipponia nippon]|uniref:probable E3 ubiquitin-protein ligase makorin-1 n=1 Tax=Nipponia nippon TaxID=128390 RepID=UPI0005114909|nr:PREDICTED: probable E3 ubiquitin-protein ligase makorin-1 [Nipponia nippon]
MESAALVASGALRARGACLRPLCRNFARGSCQRGQNCRFSHDRKSAQICRYFQSGFCSYGEQCSYQHIQEEPVPVGTRCSPVPRSRWGSEPRSVPVAVSRGWGGAWRNSAHPVPSVMHVAFKFPSVEVEEEEKDKENIPAPDNIPHGAVGGEFVPARARRASGSQLQGLGLDPNSADLRKAAEETVTWTDPAEVATESGTAAALVSTAVLTARSEAVVCGICMDRVYEKPLPEERLFGILPNCSHAYCVGCIRKWRCSRDFQSVVIKACPECRVTSSYYIPHKYWVSDVGEKEKLIETFKARTGKIRCKFFVRNRGRCPFKSDCIYLHELPAGWLPQYRQQRPRMPVEFSPSPSESSDEEDEELCMLEWALTLALMETDFRYSSYGYEMLFTDFSNSD